jgi:Rrf2 family transcriptional regulator, iron-sulfur cluster assembly transcription factor
MKLTRSASYAVGVLLRIDALAEDGQVTAARIAKGCRFPPRFLYRVLRRLVAAGLLHGTSGPGGGYALARKPERITLLEIVESVEGKPSPSVLSPVHANQRAAIAVVNRLCEQNARRFVAELRQVRLSDLIRAKLPPRKRRKARPK